MRDTGDGAVDRARAEIQAIADAFRSTAASALEDALRRRVDALVTSRAGWWDALAPPVRDAFDGAMDRAIRAGVADSMERLAADDVWLDPLVAPGISERRAGWDAALPEWVTGLIRRWARPVGRGVELDALDDPGNRIWLALVASARPLDAVFEEFGLSPSRVPSVGGGHYGIAPKTAEQLDPSGELGRVWKRYRLVHRRYVALREDLGAR